MTGAVQVERLAEAGDAVARRVYRQAALALGRALAGAVTVLDPDVTEEAPASLLADDCRQYCHRAP